MKSTDEAFRIAESIASRDRNNLYLTSRLLSDSRRYRAFCAFYSVMRLVDDRVDDLMARVPVGREERGRIAGEVAAWERLVREAYRGRLPGEAPEALREVAPAMPVISEFREASDLFPVPRDLWDEFFAAMRRDLRGEGFATFEEFLEYAAGASVAPTTIYLILLVAQEPEPGDRRYRMPPGFDYEECGRSLGLFAYLAHILRDLPEDLAAGNRGLLYLAKDDMEAFGVTLGELRRSLERGRASERVRRLLEELAGRARGYLEQGTRALNGLAGRLAPDCRFVLRLIVVIYREILERIEGEDYDPFSGRHLLGLDDKKELALRTALESDVSIESLLGPRGLGAAFS